MIELLEVKNLILPSIRTFEKEVLQFIYGKNAEIDLQYVVYRHYRSTDDEKVDNSNCV